jgi:predicted RecA/RadA family phage recombinase
MPVYKVLKPENASVTFAYADDALPIGNPSIYGLVFKAKRDGEEGWIVKRSNEPIHNENFELEYNILSKLAETTTSLTQGQSHSPYPIYLLELANKTTPEPFYHVAMPFYRTLVRKELGTLTGGMLAYDHFIVPLMLQYGKLLQALHTLGYACTDRKEDDFFLHEGRLVVIDWNLLREAGKGYDVAEMNITARLWYGMLTGYQPPRLLSPYTHRQWMRDGASEMFAKRGVISVGLRYIIVEGLSVGADLNRHVARLAGWQAVLDGSKKVHDVFSDLSEPEKRLIEADLAYRQYPTKTAEDLLEQAEGVLKFPLEVAPYTSILLQASELLTHEKSDTERAKNLLEELRRESAPTVQEAYRRWMWFIETREMLQNYQTAKRELLANDALHTAIATLQRDPQHDTKEALEGVLKHINNAQTTLGHSSQDVRIWNEAQLRLQFRIFGDDTATVAERNNARQAIEDILQAHASLANTLPKEWLESLQDATQRPASTDPRQALLGATTNDAYKAVTIALNSVEMMPEAQRHHLQRAGYLITYAKMLPPSTYLAHLTADFLGFIKGDKELMDKLYTPHQIQAERLELEARRAVMSADIPAMETTQRRIENMLNAELPSDVRESLEGWRSYLGNNVAFWQNLDAMSPEETYTRAKSIGVHLAHSQLEAKLRPLFEQNAGLRAEVEQAKREQEIALRALQEQLSLESGKSLESLQSLKESQAKQARELKQNLQTLTYALVLVALLAVGALALSLAGVGGGLSGLFATPTPTLTPTPSETPTPTLTPTPTETLTPTPTPTLPPTLALTLEASQLPLDNNPYRVPINAQNKPEGAQYRLGENQLGAVIDGDMLILQPTEEGLRAVSVEMVLNGAVIAIQRLEVNVVREPLKLDIMAHEGALAAGQEVIVTLRLSRQDGLPLLGRYAVNVEGDAMLVLEGGFAQSSVVLSANAEARLRYTAPGTAGMQTVRFTFNGEELGSRTFETRDPISGATFDAKDALERDGIVRYASMPQDFTPVTSLTVIVTGAQVGHPVKLRYTRIFAGDAEPLAIALQGQTLDGSGDSPTVTVDDKGRATFSIDHVSGGGLVSLQVVDGLTDTPVGEPLQVVVAWARSSLLPRLGDPNAQSVNTIEKWQAYAIKLSDTLFLGNEYNYRVSNTQSGDASTAWHVFVLQKPQAEGEPLQVMARVFVRETQVLGGALGFENAVNVTIAGQTLRAFEVGIPSRASGSNQFLLPNNFYAMMAWQTSEDVTPSIATDRYRVGGESLRVNDGNSPPQTQQARSLHVIGTIALSSLERGEQLFPAEQG